MAKRYRQVEPARKKTIQLIVWLLARAVRPNNNRTTLRELARELADVAKRWKTWLVELGENLSLIKFKPTRSSSSQVGSKTMPNMDQVENLAKGGLGLGGPFEYRYSGITQLSNLIPADKSNVTATSVHV